MSNIYEALEHAKRSVHVVEPPAESQRVSEPPLPTVLDAAMPDMEEEMISLFHTIVAALPTIGHRSVLLIGSSSNEGTTTIARQLARAVSLRLEKDVLLIDLDRSRPDLHVYPGLKPQRNLDEVMKTGESINETLCRIEDTSLYVMPLFQTTMLTPKTLESAKGDVFWGPLKERFDLIIVDSPPATLFPDGPGIVSQVDGVILVVEAEKTRWPVALSVRDKIVKSGGNVIGIAFNKRRLYIPRWLYKRL